MTHIFYINLDRVPQRSEFMESQLASLHLKDLVERVPAVDAAVEGALENSGYSAEDWRPRWNVAKTLIAGFMSHRAVWQRVVDRQLPTAIVMEDDVLFSADFPQAIAALEQATEVYDVVKLDGADQARRYGPSVRVGQLQLRSILQEVPSAAAYMLTQAGAQRLLELSLQFADHIDDFIFRPREGWRSFQLFPAVAVQGMFCHQSATADCSWLVAKSERVEAIPSLNTGVEKGPFSFRASKEIIRSMRKTRQVLWGDRMLLKRGGFIGRPTLAADLGPYKNDQ